MKKCISLFLICACLLALGGCVTETERVRSATTQSKTSSATASLSDSNTRDYPAMNSPMSGQPH